jgi:hypothetical protein
VAALILTGRVSGRDSNPGPEVSDISRSSTP